MLSEFQRTLVDDVMVPYMVKSDIKIAISGVITYYQLLEMYCK